MYLAVDIGGTKTLVAIFNEDGQPTAQLRFETPPDYPDFLKVFKNALKQLDNPDLKAGVVAVPGRLDRHNGRALGYGSLHWGKIPIEYDIEQLAGCPISLENDSKLAGLSEAILIKNDFKRVLYVTIGTGISDALIMNGVIDPAMADSEGGQMWLGYRGKRKQWEDLASGSAIVKDYRQKASDIDNPKWWDEIADKIAVGLINLIVTTQPEVIVLGGGVSTNFNKFIKPLERVLKRYSTPLTPIPPIQQAKRPEEAVIYGCYELIKQKYGHHFKKTK